MGIYPYLSKWHLDSRVSGLRCIQGKRTSSTMISCHLAAVKSSNLRFTIESDWFLSIRDHLYPSIHCWYIMIAFLLWIHETLAGKSACMARVHVDGVLYWIICNFIVWWFRLIISHSIIFIHVCCINVQLPVSHYSALPYMGHIFLQPPSAEFSGRQPHGHNVATRPGEKQRKTTEVVRSLWGWRPPSEFLAWISAVFQNWISCL